jgi:hypothetical protein
MSALNAEMAQAFAEIALGHVRREYPHKLDQVLNGPADLGAPSALHPIFHGSFDWHSCVHAYWLLLKLRRRFPDLEAVPRIEALADEMLTAEKAAGERAYLDRPYTAGFERPYGWAWLLTLHGEAMRHDRGWGEALQPLATAFAERFRSFLPKQTYPIRVGTHPNTAFALIHALAWADACDAALGELIRSRALHYFGEDRECQAWEPGGDEFLSSALVEALCMLRVLGPEGFGRWRNQFLPWLSNRQPATLFVPALVSDRADGKIAHLDGFNLSRAWCWREISKALDLNLARLASETAHAHLEASLPFIAGHYMGEHWLATFGLLALDGLD